MSRTMGRGAGPALGDAIFARWMHNLLVLFRQGARTTTLLRALKRV